VCSHSYPQVLIGNTGLFYSYNIREEDEDVIKLAMNRSISVTVGVVWAGIVSRYWWPTEARRELGRALGEWAVLLESLFMSTLILCRSGSV